MSEEPHSDIVILDIGLPDMSGYEPAARLRQTAVLQNTTLIALTGREADKHRAFEAGFSRHLVKPVTFEALIADGSRQSAA